MQKFLFDGPNKLFIAKPGVTDVDVVVDLYSDWMEEILLGDNMKWLQAMRVIGGDPKGVGQWAGSTVFLMNGWKIRAQEADHTLTLNGDLWLDSDTHPGPMFVPTLGGYSVLLQLKLSTLVETIATGGGDPGVIADAVLDSMVAGRPPGSLGATVKQTDQDVLAVAGEVTGVGSQVTGVGIQVAGVAGQVDGVADQVTAVDVQLTDVANLLADASDLVEDLHDEAFGGWKMDPAAATWTLYRKNGAVMRVFNLKVAAGDVPAFVERTPA